MKYRREIDGLRALAVLPVMLFHADVAAFSGGFVGVDVFFVISGFLITSILLADLSTGRYSIARFYERRARRILPSLCLVLLVCLPFAWLWFAPADLVDFSRSLVSVSAFGSNFFFWLQGDYFGADSLYRPLLHTWSLALEEQYYLLFPLMLALAWRLGRRWLMALLLAGLVASFGAAMWAALHKPVAAFYLLPTRAWELLLGALASCWLAGSVAGTGAGAQPAPRGSPWLAQLASLVGLALIVEAIVVFNQDTPFPGPVALVPALGTALVLLFGTADTWVGRLLGNRILVGIGLVSYSAYLWHQPLIVFARYQLMNRSEPLLFLALVLASLLLAWGSWRFVEQPFRNAARVSRAVLVRCALAATVVLVAAGMLGQMHDGFAERLTATERAVYEFKKYPRAAIYREGRCFLKNDQGPQFFASECDPPDPAAPALFVWGDSHAAALSYGLLRAGRNVAQFTSTYCPPLLDEQVTFRPDCAQVNQGVLEHLRRLRPARVLLHGNWLMFKDHDPATTLRRTLAAIFSVLPQAQVTLVGGVPQWSPGLPDVMLRNDLSLDGDRYLENFSLDGVGRIDRQLRELAQSDPRLRYFSIVDGWCRDGYCKAVSRLGQVAQPVVWDYGHLTGNASVELSGPLGRGIYGE